MPELCLRKTLWHANLIRSDVFEKKNVMKWFSSKKSKTIISMSNILSVSVAQRLKIWKWEIFHWLIPHRFMHSSAPSEFPIWFLHTSSNRNIYGNLLKFPKRRGCGKSLQFGCCKNNAHNAETMPAKKHLAVITVLIFDSIARVMIIKIKTFFSLYVTLNRAASVNWEDLEGISVE